MKKVDTFACVVTALLAINGVPWIRTQQGESGAWIGERLPEIATVVDGLCL